MFGVSSFLQAVWVYSQYSLFIDSSPLLYRKCFGHSQTHQAVYFNQYILDLLLTQERFSSPKNFEMIGADVSLLYPQLGYHIQQVHSHKNLPSSSPFYPHFSTQSNEKSTLSLNLYCSLDCKSQLAIFLYTNNVCSYKQSCHNSAEEHPLWNTPKKLKLQSTYKCYS